MTDQSFSSKNLSKIYYEQNKKGKNVAMLLFDGEPPMQPEVDRARELIRRVVRKRGKYTKEVFRLRLLRLFRIRRKYKASRKKLIEERLEGVSRKIRDNKFDFVINELSARRKNKKVYAINDDPESYFVEKKLQKNIKFGCSVKQADRDVVIPQLKSVLDNEFPKIVVKTDINAFYESIDRGKLLSKINEKSELSLTTRKLIRKLLQSYKEISGNDFGVPRGIGVSAYLAELYLRDFDNKVKSMPNLVYYARYVDDIVVVFSPQSKRNANDLFDEIKSFITVEGLSFNMKIGKTRIIDCIKQNYRFDFLGYSFTKSAKFLSLGISRAKLIGYKNKIDCAVNSFVRGMRRSPRKSRREIKSRLCFLTGNTRLSNNKGNALVGIYNSNKWIDSRKDLLYLDEYLERKLSHLTYLGLSPSIEKISFEKGFSEKRFVTISPKEFSIVVSAWNNKEL